jgi:hypothetical protein
MAILPPFVGPRAGIADLLAFMRQRSREQRIGAVLAVVVTLLIVVGVFYDSKVNTAPRPTVIYTESWSANRTDAEIVADQKKHQEAREAARLKRQREFQKLQNQLGIE